MTWYPNNFPYPINSLKKATKINITPYPAAFPTQSRKDFHTPFPNAKASNRPITIQFVIMSPMKIESYLLTSYAKARKI